MTIKENTLTSIWRVSIIKRVALEEFKVKLSFKELEDYSSSNPLQINELIDLKDTLRTRFPDEILDASQIQLTGTAFTNKGDVILDLRVNGTVTVPSTRSLEPVELPLDFMIDEIYVLTQAAEECYDETEAVFIVENGVIDVNNTVAENIVLQIPMSVLSSDEAAGKNMPKGNDWEVLSAEEFEQRKEDNKKVDPRLAKLSELFNDEDNDD